jgi:hypothetical protein
VVARVVLLMRAPPKCLYHPCILSGNLGLTFMVA